MPNCQSCGTTTFIRRGALFCDPCEDGMNEEPRELCPCGSEPQGYWWEYYASPLCEYIECLVEYMAGYADPAPTVDKAILKAAEDYEARCRSWDRTLYEDKDPEQAAALRRSKADLFKLVRHKHQIVVPPLPPPLD
ncbi:MAG: hypothetical protein GTO63_07990 [Anaerolineae bacterium]|nr:hypothetical protein [Anaerolineae bacterium]NIN94870.1 hypothetical protein [Anaerolineae bacterium]NIQ77921.1 hypothetical protein [Anaerolineae bacterium]